MTDKPWSNACTPSCDRPRLDRFCYDRDLGCPVQYLFEEFVASSTNFAAREAWDASCTEPLSACKAALLPQMACHEGELDLFTKLFISDFVPKPSVPMANILQTCAEHEDVMSFASQSLPFTHRTQVVACPELWLDPLSLEAVSIPEFQCPSVRLSRPQVGVAKLHGAPHTHPPEADSSSSASAVPTLRPTGTRQAVLQMQRYRPMFRRLHLGSFEDCLLIFKPILCELSKGFLLDHGCCITSIFHDPCTLGK